MIGHVIFQDLLNESVRVNSVINGDLAGLCELIRIAIAVQTKKTVAASIELLGITVLLEDLLDQKIQVFGFTSGLLKVISRATVQIGLILRTQMLFYRRISSL